MRWNVWIKELPMIENFRVSRCIKSKSLKEIASAQLHTFADASERGYGAICYIRFERCRRKDSLYLYDCQVKSCSAEENDNPANGELSAAVCAAKIERLIRKESDLDIQRSIFWIDSTCVLGYLNNTTKCFQTFVANRVGTIRETTESTHWKHVSDDENPADDVSRGFSAAELLNSKRWVNGPQFLWCPEDSWPAQPATVQTISNNDPEVKSNVQTFLVSYQSKITMDEITKRFSTWHQLTKFAAWMLRYRTNLLHRKIGGNCTNPHTKGSSPHVLPLTVDEIEAAAKSIIRYVQEGSYQRELSVLGRS